MAELPHQGKHLVLAQPPGVPEPAQDAPLGGRRAALGGVERLHGHDGGTRVGGQCTRRGLGGLAGGVAAERVPVELVHHLVRTLVLGDGVPDGRLGTAAGHDEPPSRK
ncbi:hypothetical protein ACSR0Z_30280 (plasmid) [Streptomyces viridosporus]